MAGRVVTEPKRSNRETGLAVDRLSRTERHALAEHVRERMAALGMNIQQVAERAKINRRSIEKILKKQTNSPDLPVLRALARALDTAFACLRGFGNYVNPEEATVFPLIGQAAVGKFRPQRPPVGGALSSHTGQLHVPPIPLDPRLADKPRFAVPILDDQLEGLTPPVSPGQTALVVAFSGDEMEIESGKIYLVHRQDSEGRIETTFRRVTVYHDRYELAFVSRNIESNEAGKLVVPRADFGNNQIEICGLFYATVCQYA